MSIVKAFRSLLSRELRDNAQNSKEVLKYLKSCQVKTIALKDGDTLAVVIKSDDIDESTIRSIKESLRSGYGDKFQKVALFGVATTDDVDYGSLKEIVEKLYPDSKQITLSDLHDAWNYGKRSSENYIGKDAKDSTMVRRMAEKLGLVKDTENGPSQS